MFRPLFLKAIHTHEFLLHTHSLLSETSTDNKHANTRAICSDVVWYSWCLSCSQTICEVPWLMMLVKCKFFEQKETHPGHSHSLWTPWNEQLGLLRTDPWVSCWRWRDEEEGERHKRGDQKYITNFQSSALLLQSDTVRLWWVIEKDCSEWSLSLWRVQSLKSVSENVPDWMYWTDPAHRPAMTKTVYPAKCCWLLLFKKYCFPYTDKYRWRLCIFGINYTNNVNFILGLLVSWYCSFCLLWF